jgi:hypothetical protein
VSLAVPVEPTVAPGQTITSAWANASVRDAINFVINPPEAVISQTAVQSIATSAFTPLQFDTTTQDTYGSHSNTVNNTRMTAQVAGWYQIDATYAAAVNGTGGRQVVIAKNGTQITTSLFGVASSTLINLVLQTSALVQLNVGDYVEAQGWQSSGGNLNTVTTQSGMTAVWVHA